MSDFETPKFTAEKSVLTRETINSAVHEQLGSLAREIEAEKVNADDFFSVEQIQSIQSQHSEVPQTKAELDNSELRLLQAQQEFAQNEAIVQQATAIETQINERGLPRDEKELAALTDQYEKITQQLDAADIPREPDTLKREITYDAVPDVRVSQEFDFANIPEINPELVTRERTQSFMNVAFEGWESSMGVIDTPEDPEARETKAKEFVKEIYSQLTGEEELPPIQNAEAWKVIDRAAKLFKIGSGGYLDPALLQPESPLLREFIAANKAAILNRAIDFEANFAKVADIDSVRQKIETEKQRGQSETQLAANENQTAPAEQAA